MGDMEQQLKTTSEYVIVPHQYEHINSTQDYPHGDLQTALKNLDTYFVPFMIFIGITLNGLTVIVIMTTHLFKLSGFTYLCCIGMSDCGYLAICVVHWLELIAGINISNQEGYCQIFTYFAYALQFLSAWYIVGFTVDRYINVCLPRVSISMCTPFRAKLVASSLGILAIYSYIYMTWFWSATEETHGLCSIDSHYMALGFVLLKLNSTFSFILPYSCVVVLSVVLMWNIIRQDGVHIGLPILHAEQQEVRETRIRHLRESHAHLNIIHFVIVVLTLFLLVPAKICETLAIFKPFAAKELHTLSVFLSAMHYVYFFCKPFVYFISSSQFRYYTYLWARGISDYVSCQVCRQCSKHDRGIPIRNIEAQSDDTVDERL